VGRIAGFEPRRGELGPRLKAKHRFAAGDPHSPPTKTALRHGALFFV
jgi:hypothetical protein